MAEAKSLSEFLRPTTNVRYSNTPSDISADTCRAHLALLATLMRGFGMGGRSWIRQFVSVFPLLARVSIVAFPRNGKPDAPHPDIATISDKTEQISRERASHPDTKESTAIWTEISERGELRWADGPFGLTDSARLASDDESIINIAFRPPPVRPRKARACDNSK